MKITEITAKEDQRAGRRVFELRSVQERLRVEVTSETNMGGAGPGDAVQWRPGFIERNVQTARDLAMLVAELMTGPQFFRLGKEGEDDA
jgi:hypothetical protein